MCPHSAVEIHREGEITRKRKRQNGPSKHIRQIVEHPTGRRKELAAIKVAGTEHSTNRDSTSPRR